MQDFHFSLVILLHSVRHLDVLMHFDLLLLFLLVVRALTGWLWQFQRESFPGARTVRVPGSCLTKLSDRFGFAGGTFRAGGPPGKGSAASSRLVRIPQ